jgi:putative tributyrin esterase
MPKELLYFKTNTMESLFFTTEKASFNLLDFITVKSNALKGRADICVYNPVPEQALENIPVVILLHGVYGSHWAWAIKGKVHETLAKMVQTGACKPMLLVMPSDGLLADGSGYVPHQQANYEQWIVTDLLACIREQYSCVGEDSPLFISGLSMGGYGALRLGAKYPQLFKAFSGLSSITHFKQLEPFVKDFESLQEQALEQNGAFEFMLQNKETLPPFRFDCGTKDPLIAYNRKLNKQLTEAAIAHTYVEHPGGHEWEYWEKHIAETLLFFNQYC